MRNAIVLDGRKILGLLLFKGKHRKGLAREIKVDRKTIDNAVNGKMIDAKTALAIARALGVSSDALRPSLFSIPFLSTKGLPTNVGELIGEAHEAELIGEPWKASDLFRTAQELLRQLKPAARQALREINARRRLNDEWSRRIRVAEKGTSDPTQVKLVDRCNRVIGSATKQEVHREGWLHHTVIIVLRTPDGRIACERRHKDTSYWDRLDFLGGHTLISDVGPLQTALREANEEVRLFLGRRRVPVEVDWLKQIGRAYQFTVNVSTTRAGEPFINRERSTLFALTVPPHPALYPEIQDEAFDGIHFVEMNLEVYSLSTLVERFKTRPDEFADGAARILKKYNRDITVRRALDRLFE